MQSKKKLILFAVILLIIVGAFALTSIPTNDNPVDVSVSDVPATPGFHFGGGSLGNTNSINDGSGR